ncbi:MAG: DUF6443 domain-containing protein [Chitinophagaceae bacterium]
MSKITVSLLIMGTILCSKAHAQINYVRTWDAAAPEQDGNILMTKPYKDVKQATQYFDGLGRPVQTVMREGSLETGGTATDVVSPVVYDQYGREPFKYLPFVANTAGGNTSLTDGAYKPNALVQQQAFMTAEYGAQGETVFYGKTNFEASPLNRVEKAMAPGNSWAGSNRGVEMKYWFNTIVDDVKVWKVDNVTEAFGTYSINTTVNGGVYPAGELVKNVTVDEHGKQVIEFKDKEGKVILKKVQLTGPSDDGTGIPPSGAWLCTYYLYDDMNNLRCVIQPEGVKLLPGAGWLLSATQLAEQCFRYEYDNRGRMIKKKVPGAGEVWMVYDAKDRLVLTQDANLRTQQKWMYTTYDAFNRPEATGLITDPANYNNHGYHLSLGYVNSPYPILSNYTSEELSKTFYDSYSWLGSYGNPLPATYNSSYNTFFQTVSNTVWPYAQANVQTTNLKGMPTGSRVKVLGTSTYLYNISFYDDKGRVIQVQGTNITGGTDIATTQYTWAGQPLVAIQKQQKNGAATQQHIVVTKMEYDHQGRVLAVKKIVNSTIGAIALNKPEQLIVSNKYNKLGQLKEKQLGAGPGTPLYGAGGLLNYDYNIRGWLLGMNRDYLTTTGQSGSKKFGFELGYDKLTNSSGRNFTAQQFNGNITGMTWKSDGDDVKRKYDFTYDAANRLLKGEYEQDDATSSWNAATMNFTMQMGNGTDPLTAYDANGNIKAMTQYGWKLGGNVNTPIDNLTYNYIAGTNKLLNVIDASNDPLTKLGDFRTSSLHPNQSKTTTTVDYTYDANGNLKKDLNKDIGTAAAEDIIYNHLNLPQSITVRKAGGLVKGTITYTYDAAGNKIKKEVAETGQLPKTTLYLGGAVYENDVLQFLGQEEGRIRYQPESANGPDNLHYDYMIKDHLGNVRMVLTEQQITDAYPPASMETAQATTEEALYANLPATRVSKPAGYPADTYTNPNDEVAKTNGSGNKIGPAIVLKVMAGDKFNIRVNSWYKTYGASPGTPVSSLNDLLSALAGGIGNIGGGHGGATGTEITNSGVLTPGLTNFLNSQSYNSSKPKAFINWIFLDEQFKYYAGGVEQVGSNEELKTHLFNDVPVNKSGWLYVYVSNETPNIDVFFDNLQVTHIRSAMVETNEYYPFGLLMKNISYRSMKNEYQENKRMFNGGNELQSKEFNDGSGLEMYDASNRFYDAQIGRFHQIDPLANLSDNWSTYAFASNNPILRNDPLGLKDSIVVGSDKKKEHVRSVITGENVTVTGKRKRAAASSSQTNYVTFGALLLTREAVGSRFGWYGIGFAFLWTVGEYAIKGPTIEELINQAAQVTKERLLQWAKGVVANHAATLAALAAWGGQQEKLYEIYAESAGAYRYLKGGRFWKMLDEGEIDLAAGAVWKYGTTKQTNVIGGPGQNPARYSSGELGNGLQDRVIYTGNKAQVLAMQAYKIAEYFLANGDLPPGNKATW